MEICTERCLIRRFEEPDIDDFMVYRNDMDWMKYQGFKGLTKQEYEDALLGDHTFQDGVQLAVIHKKSGKLIGDVYLKQEGDSFWIGYSVCRTMACQGYACEAAGCRRNLFLKRQRSRMYQSRSRGRQYGFHCLT